MKLENILLDKQNMMIVVLAAVILIFSSYAITGFLTYQPDTDNTDSSDDVSGDIPINFDPNWVITSFTDQGNDVELIDGKPVIRMFSTTRCPHCVWAGPTYEKVVQEYVDAGKIVAYHWEVDVNDDTLTEAEEGEVPESELAVFYGISPRGSIPTYVFGGKYTRIGNGFERTKDLISEEKEFRAMIEQLIDEAGL